MTQYARPDSTEAAGNWYDTEMSAQNNLHEETDEASADDNDFIQVMDEDGSTLVTCKLGLSNVSDPSNAINHKVIVRAQGVDSGEGVPELQFALYDVSDGNLGVGQSGVTPSDEWSNQTFTLAASGADAITNYNNLQIWLTMDPDGADFGGLFVSQVYFECDDAAAAVTTNPAFLLFID